MEPGDQVAQPATPQAAAVSSPQAAQTLVASPAASALVASPAASQGDGTPVRTLRPVCFSLHKYFSPSQGRQAPSPDRSGRQQIWQSDRLPFEARQEIPQASPSWQAQAEQEAGAMQASVDSLVERQPGQAAVVQAVSRFRPVRTRGGRPKKAEGSAKASYRPLTGQQAVWAVKRIQQLLQVPGARLTKTLQSVASHPDLRVSLAAVKPKWNDREHWLEWGRKNQIDGCSKPGTWRGRGQKHGHKRRGSQAKGCRKAGSRGYLGRTDYCRGIVQAVRVWAEVQQAQGHELHR